MRLGPGQRNGHSFASGQVGGKTTGKAGARQLTRRSSLHSRALQIAFVSIGVMSVFEITKMALMHDIRIWISPLITIFFTGSVGAVAGALILMKEEGLRLQVAAIEERYRLLFERSLTGAYRTALDGRVLDCNVSFCQMFGYATREEVIGNSVEVGYLNKVDRDRFIARLRAEKTLTNFEQHLLRADGSTVTVLNSATLVEDGDSSEPFIKGTLTDITELRNAEREQRRLAAIVQCSDDAIVSLKLSGAVETWNGGAESIYGYSAVEMVGESIAVLAPANRKNEYLQALKEITDGRQMRLETIRVTKDGRYIHVAVSVSPITDASGHVLGAAAITRDITDLKTAEEALRKSEVQYRLLFDRNPIPMWVFDRSTLRFLAVNEAAIRQYGYSEREFMDMTIRDIRPESDVPDLLADTDSRHRGLQRPAPWRHKTKGGVILDVEIICHDLDFHGREAMLVAAYDVTERKRAQEAVREAEKKFRGIFENAVVGIFQGTPDGRPTSVNRALATMHGYSSPEEMLTEVSNVAQQLFVDPNQIEELSRIAIEQGVARSAEVEVYRRDRTRFWTRVNLRTVRNAAGDIVSFEGTVEDITDRKAAEERIQYLAYYDALTALPNRALLEDRLEVGLAGARRRREQVAVMVFDLDRFTILNDSLGRAFGDQILKEVAQRLRSIVREQDTVARAGRDEFIILLNSVHDFAASETAAASLMEYLARPFDIQGQNVSTSCSIGISVYPLHGVDTESLIKNAEAAMHSAKEDGRNSFRFFAEAMNGKHAEELALETALRSALAENEFFLVYQPEIDLASGTITGMEALIRWRHPQLGLVPPDRFIPIAENSGEILPIGEWVLRTACAQVSQWRTGGLSVVPVAVNVSAVQFRNDNFCTLVRQVLHESGLPPAYLELELTERMLLSNADRTSSQLNELKSIGVKVAIDDFGTGYSSLSYLKQFRVNKLKIDRSFVKDLPTDGDDAAITTAIISMAKSLKLTVIGEGVETEEQVAFLREHHCDEAQGYYFSKPVTPEEMFRKLEAVLSATN